MARNNTVFYQLTKPISRYRFEALKNNTLQAINYEKWRVGHSSLHRCFPTYLLFTSTWHHL